MNSEIINTIGQWVVILSLVATCIYMAVNGRVDLAYGFGVGAGLFYLLFVA